MRQPTASGQNSYSGAWRASATYADQALPLGPGVDPSHMRPDMPDPGQVVAGYPRVDHPPMYLTQEPDDAWKHELDTPGLLLDTEPITHDPGDVQTYHAIPEPGIATLPPNVQAHMVSRGADLRQSYEEPQMRGSAEEPRTERWEQGAINSGSILASRRGANSLPENNPDGYRIGWSVKRYYHRWLPIEQMRHTERALHPVTAAKAASSPAMTARQSNRYTSPFAWQSFWGSKAQQFPILRRQPPESWDADSGNDGMSQESDVPADWVIG